MATKHFTHHTKRFVDIAGQIFYHLKAVRFVGRDEKSKQLWEFECLKCGALIVRRGGDVKTGRVRACGCQQFAGGRRTHGLHGTKEYVAWKAMNQRCADQNTASFANYGARGIVVCDRWSESFQAFIADMGNAPSAKHSIERKDNDGPYCPENCAWATRAVQSRNTRQNRFLTFHGRTLTVTDWAKEIGISKDALFSRIRRGWSVEKSLTEKTS